MTGAMQLSNTTANCAALPATITPVLSVKATPELALAPKETEGGATPDMENDTGCPPLKVPLMKTTVRTDDIMLAVAMGGVAQRATWMGFALASAPLAIIALGPLEGVLLMNLLGLPAAGLALFLLWRKIEWNVILPMFIPCVLGIWLGVWFLGEIDPAFLEVGIGLALLLAVIITVKSPPLPSTTSLFIPATLTGLSSGFLNAVASIGGPPLVVFRNLKRWSPESFTPSIQPLLITMSGGSFLLKTLSGPVPLPSYSIISWVGLIGALGAGILLGQLISRKISLETTSKAITWLAILGSLATLIRGSISLVT
jgi:uncharacterized membrane protein YfcA